MAAPPSTAVSPVVSLSVRVLTFVCLLISLIVLATNKVTSGIGFDEVTVKFNDFYVYRYMLATTVIGMAYTMLLTALAIFHVSSGNRLGGDGFAFLEFFGDKGLSYMLATGAAAGFGFTVDLNRDETDSDTRDFLNKSNAAASVLLIAFIFSAVSSVFSSLSLPKRA